MFIYLLSGAFLYTFHLISLINLLPLSPLSLYIIYIYILIRTSPGTKKIPSNIMAQETKILHAETIHIPEDLLHQLILPRLPCKPLARFKAVSKVYQAMISSDTSFSTLQSLSPSPASTGFVYVEESGLSFFPNQDVIGIPDPSLKFMVKSPEHVKLLSSANGLLLFYLFYPVNSLCVCNPATMQKEILPKELEEDIISREMGLAFDPHLASGRYTVVNPLFSISPDGITYSFNVFRSETGKWKFSQQRVFVPGSINAPSRPVYAKGMLYWMCLDYLLWFDPENDCAGTISLPYYKNLESARQEVEVFKDEISCLCLTSEGGVEVWVLTAGTQWKRLHELSITNQIHESPENQCFGLGEYEILGQYSDSVRNFVTPLAFDGRNVYVSVDSKAWSRKMDLVTTPKRITFDRDVLLSVTEDYNFSDMEFDANDDCETDYEENLLYCDMVTGKVVNTGKSMTRTSHNYRVFYYHNSMIALPPILK